MSSETRKPGESQPGINVGRNEGVVAGTIKGPIAIGRNASAHSHEHPGARAGVRRRDEPQAPVQRDSPRPTPVRSPASVASGLRTIRIFVASSSELRDERNMFDLHFRQANDLFLRRGVYLKIVRWEGARSALSETRTQDDSDGEVARCDIFLSLFFTKAGAFTEEEFDTAERSFRDSGRPLIYTFFKDAEIRTGDASPEDLNSLWAFQRRLTHLGHFWSRYSTIDDLLNKFRVQLDDFLAREE